MVDSGLCPFEVDKVGEHQNDDEQDDNEDNEENEDSVGFLGAASSRLLGVLKLIFESELAMDNLT